MIQYFLRVPCFFLIKHLPSFLFFIGVELIHKSSFSYPFDELLFFYYKRVIEAIHSFFQIYCVFTEHKLWQGDTNNDYNISLVSGMHILKEVSFMAVSFPSIHFFWDSVIISREHLKKFTYQGNCV